MAKRQATPKAIKEVDMFCPNCGRDCGTHDSGTTVYCPACGTPVSAPGATSDHSSSQFVNADTFQAGQLGMKWYKFVIWFQLFAGAITLVATGATLITGSHYAGYSDLTYFVFDDLKLIDVAFGVIFIALAVKYVLVRQELARFQIGAPGHYLTTGITAVSAQVLYIVCASLVTGIEMEVFLNPTFAWSIISSLVMFGASKYYFDRRARLFCN